MPEEDGKPQGDPAAAKTGGDDRTFSQDQVNTMLAEDRRKNEARFEGFEDYKAKAARFDELEQANATELEKAVKKAREEASSEARNELTRERVLDKIEVAAAGKFADVTDARLRLGQRASEFIKTDGAIDTAAIAKAVETELEAAPHLKVDGKGTRPRPDPSQGAHQGKPEAGAQGRAMAEKRFGTKTNATV